MKKHAFICVICILSAFISLFNLVLYAFKGRFVDNNSISKAVETALVVKVLDLSGNPIEDAAVFIVETERVYYTGANGATAEISVPIESGDDWGTVTFAVIKDGFVEYIGKLGAANGVEIKTVEDVKKALSIAMDRFESLGCKASDHGLDYVMYRPATDEQVEAIFQKAMAGEAITMEEAEMYVTAIVLFCGREYARRNWVMQIHYCVQRNTNTKRFEALGPDVGCDCISAHECSEALTALLNAMDKDDLLPKTVLYSLNPSDNALLGSIIGCFQGTGAAGKIQHGSAWWFNDNKTGMQTQMTDLANLSLLGNFIGMLTDSRSFLSYTRHEYFRRILCNLIGGWVENGEYPNDIPALGAMVQDICYNNAKNYFGF